MPRLFDIDYPLRPKNFDKYSIMTFPDWKRLYEFAMGVKEMKNVQTAELANRKFKGFIDKNIKDGDKYGMFGKAPNDYDDAMKRDKFIYYEQYKEIKKQVVEKVNKDLSKNSTAEVMKPKFVFNDKQLGEFMFDKASMSLIPNVYLYSPFHKREVDSENEKIKNIGDLMYLSDDSLVIYAIKIIINADKEDEYNEYLEIGGEDTLLIASENYPNGIIDCTSTNKKVYLYKEKKPKMFDAVKIIVGLSAGGYTSWVNDFYTGIATVVMAEIFESLGYSVQIEVVLGGGRCIGCHKKLRFDNVLSKGRRYFGFTAKKFDDIMDLDGLLYTTADPSFHKIKFVSIINYLFTLYGDEIDTHDTPASTWHGIEPCDMINPIGMYYKFLDDKKGNKNILHFYNNQISKDNVVQRVFDTIVESEYYNMLALKKFKDYDFGDFKQN